LKFHQRKLKESKQVAEPKAKQQQVVAASLPAVAASEAPAPGRKRGRKPKSEESFAPIA
jgi:hypothetical protein